MIKKLYEFTGERDGEECFALIEISSLTSEEAQRQNQILRQAWSSLCWTEPEQPGSELSVVAQVLDNLKLAEKDDDRRTTLHTCVKLLQRLDRELEDAFDGIGLPMLSPTREGWPLLGESGRISRLRHITCTLGSGDCG